MNPSRVLLVFAWVLVVLLLVSFTLTLLILATLLSLVLFLTLSIFVWCLCKCFPSLSCHMDTLAQHATLAIAMLVKSYAHTLIKSYAQTLYTQVYMPIETYTVSTSAAKSEKEQAPPPSPVDSSTQEPQEAVPIDEVAHSQDDPQQPLVDQFGDSAQHNQCGTTKEDTNSSPDESDGAGTALGHDYESLASSGFESMSSGGYDTSLPLEGCSSLESNTRPPGEDTSDESSSEQTYAEQDTGDPGPLHCPSLRMQQVSSGEESQGQLEPYVSSPIQEQGRNETCSRVVAQELSGFVRGTGRIYTLDPLKEPMASISHLE